MIRTVDTTTIIQNIKEMCIEANHFLSADMDSALKQAAENEKSEIGKKILNQLQDNLQIAASDMIPICQDTGMAVIFFAPHSFTGEDTVEITCHGGIAVTAAVLEAALWAGARLAEAGGNVDRERFLVEVLTPLSRGEEIAYRFDAQTISAVHLVFDSDLDREYTDGNPDALHTSSTLFFPKTYNNTTFGFPKCLIKHYKIEILDELKNWKTIIEISDNHQRFIKHELNTVTKAVRLIPISTYHSERKTEDYGSSTAHIFNFEIF